MMQLPRGDDARQTWQLRRLKHLPALSCCRDEIHQSGKRDRLGRTFADEEEMIRALGPICRGRKSLSKRLRCEFVDA
jgi:hypothetical protein